MKTAQTRAKLVPLALLVAVSAIAFAAIFFRKAQPTHPLAAAGIRLCIATALLAPMVIRGWRRGTLPLSHIKLAAIGGVLYGLHFGAWVWSLQLTTVAAAVTLVTATPLLLAIVALVTGRDRPTGKHWVAIALSLVGVVLIGGADFSHGLDALLGDLLAFVGAAAMAAYLLVVRGESKHIDVLAFSGVACAVGAGVLAGAALVAGVPFAPANDEALMYLALAALVPQIVGHGLLTWAVKHTTPVIVGIATVGEPVGATVLSWLWLGETASNLVLVGCAVTLSGVIVATLPSRSASSR